MDLVESFSGIRGIYGQAMTGELAYKYAFLYTKLFLDKDSVVVIARDSRISGPEMSLEISKALSDFGVSQIIDLGIVPIQVCEYYILKSKASGGIYITASHNEPEYNGLKILKEDGSILYAKQMESLIKAVHESARLEIESKEKIKIVDKHDEAIEKYIEHVLDFLGDSVDKIKKSKFKILADPNGGSSVVVLDKLFSRLSVEAEIINDDLGTFVRQVEPNAESLKYLEEKLKEDFVFACGFDCDSDRVELVLPPQVKFSQEMSATLSGQYVLSLACDAVLADAKEKTVVVNDCTSYLLRDVLEKYKSKIIEVEVGETNVVKAMEEQDSVIGGEGSNGGVVVFPIKCRDGIMTVVLILKMMAEYGEKLADILLEYPRYYSARDKLSCSAQQSSKIKESLEEYFETQGLEIKKTGGSSGGLKILFDKNSYLWFRQSKTEMGVFRIIADGDDKQKVKDILKQGIDLFNQFIK